jgi:hypothetical protein
MTVLSIFKHCVEAIRAGSLIERVSKTDKEYHFQNWFMMRLGETGLNFEIGGRNSYPDFRMVATTEGYELKGLAYPGRDDRASTTGARSTTSSGAIRRGRMATPTPSWIS